MWVPDYKQLAIAALVLAVGVQTIRLNAEKTAHLQSKAGHAETLKAIAERTAQAQRAVASFAQARLDELSEKDRQHSQELHHAKTDNDRLRLATRSGLASVRLKGYDCATHTGTVPAPTFTGSLGHAGTAVDGEFREAVFNHRAALIQAELQIKYLQDYAHICQKVPTP